MNNNLIKNHTKYEPYLNLLDLIINFNIKFNNKKKISYPHICKYELQHYFTHQLNKNEDLTMKYLQKTNFKNFKNLLDVLIKSINTYERKFKKTNIYPYADCEICDENQYNCLCNEDSPIFCHICEGGPCICGRILYLFSFNKI